MLNMSKGSRAFLEENLPEVLSMQRTNDALDAVDDWILMYGFDENYDYNEDGEMGQAVFDDLFKNND